MQIGRKGFTMPRRGSNTAVEENTEATDGLEEFAEVEATDENDEVDSVPETAEGEKADKPAKAPKQPARGSLEEGLVTPVGFAKIVTERELHTDKKGGHEVRPQMVYSYIKNAPKEDPFPLQTVKDSIGVDRQVVKIEDGIAWWERKNARVGERKANAEAKAAKKAENASKKQTTEAEGESNEAPAEVVEAE
jgi:hypothetical protein